VLIRALQESRRLEVLSRPQVMTLDNQPAFVQVGKRVPRIIGSAVTQYGQQNAIVLENVGLILGVTPRISPDGRVVMEVDAEKSEVGPVDEGIPVSTTGTTVIKSPNILLTTAQTTVSALDGETIIIGGLITKSTTQSERKVPLLADIPLLGALFRYNYNARRRTEMLIILTPHIVRSPEDAERVRRAEEARMHWCLGDVSEIHGTADLPARLDEHQVPVIYPDANPRGVIPKPAQQPQTTPPEAIPPGPQVPLEPAPLQPAPVQPAPLPNGTGNATAAPRGSPQPAEARGAEGLPAGRNAGRPWSGVPGDSAQPSLHMSAPPPQIERSPPVRSMVGPADSAPRDFPQHVQAPANGLPPAAPPAGAPVAVVHGPAVNRAEIAPAQHLQHREAVFPGAQHPGVYGAQPTPGHFDNQSDMRPGAVSDHQQGGSVVPVQRLPTTEPTRPATRYSALPIPTDVPGEPSHAQPLQYYEQRLWR